MHVVFGMENDTWETQEWMKPKHASPVACLSMTAKLIRSLRDDRVISQETRMCKWLRVHDESEWSLMTSLIPRFRHCAKALMSVLPDLPTCCRTLHVEGNEW